MEKKRFTDEFMSIKTILHCFENTLSRGRTRTAQPPRHAHALVFVISGRARYTMRETFFDVREGDVFYLSKGEKYVIDVYTDDYRFICVDYLWTEDGEFLSENIKIRSVENFKRLFQELYGAFYSDKKSKMPKSYSVLYRIYADIIDERNVYTPSAKRKKAEKAFDYIKERFCDSTLRISEVAKVCNMSMAHFRRLFMETYRLSPMQAVLSLRFQKALSLLSSREATVTKIAESCGFENVYYFSKAFKKRYGVSPKEYALRIDSSN